MVEMNCTLCWMRGEVIDGLRLKTPAVLVINGLSVCHLEAHQEAALTGNLTAAMDYLSSGTWQPGPQEVQNHTGPAPGERVAARMLQRGPSGFEVMTDTVIVHMCTDDELDEVLDFIRRDYAEAWDAYLNRLHPARVELESHEDAADEPNPDAQFAKGGLTDISDHIGLL